MTATKARCGMFGPRRGYFFPEYDTRSEEMINSRQRRQLTDYIMSLHNDDEDEKEQKLAQIEEMTSAEADDYLFEVSRWQ
jgi:3-dehydroquinate dehydratase